MKTTVAAALVAAIPLSYLLWRSGAAAPLPAFAAALACALVVLAAGELCLRAAGVDEMPLPAAWVAGVFASALAVYALVLVVHLRAASAFALWTVLVIVATLYHRRRRPAATPRAAELLGMALCGAATLAWCGDVAEVPRILERDGLLAAWIDYFVHGSVVSQFGDPRAAGGGAILLAGAPVAFYHYASYMLPAAFAGALDLPGLPAATSAWLPLGFLTMCLGAYALGYGLGGRAGAVASIIALAVLPDASTYGLRNGFFSFHWHLLAFPGATYAIGVFLVAAAVLCQWLKRRDARALVAAACLASGAILFRAHLFALGWPALAATAVAATRFARERTLAAVVGAIGLFAAFVVAFYLATDSVPALEPFLTAVHEFQEPTAYTGWYAALTQSYGRAVAVPLGMVLVLVASLGVFVVFYPLSVVVASRSRGLQAADLLPSFFLLCYVLLMLTAPAVKWDATEFTVRPFVLLYAVVAVYTAATLVGWLAARGGKAGRRVQMAALLSAALGLVLVWPHTGKLGLLPKFQWGWRFYPQKVADRLPQAAAFLRRSAAPGDVFAVQGLKASWVATDPAIQIASLAGVPAYLAYTISHTADGGPRAQIAWQRHAALAKIAEADSLSVARDELRKLGVAWYAVVGAEGPRWDPERRAAAFAEGSVAIYATRVP